MRRFLIHLSISFIFDPIRSGKFDPFIFIPDLTLFTEMDQKESNTSGSKMSFFTKLPSNILKLDQSDIVARDPIFYDEFRSRSKFLCHKVFYQPVMFNAVT